MIKMHVKSLPLKEVIRDLAEAMETDYVEDCDVYELIIPEKYGKGLIFGINFPSGIGFISYDCTFHDDIQIVFSVNSVHPAKFLYVVEGGLEHKFEHESEEHHLNKYQSAIVASSNYNGHILDFRKGLSTKLFSLEIDRMRFSETLTCSIEKLQNPIKDLFHDYKAEKTFYHEGGYSLGLFNILRKMVFTSFTGLSRQLFLLSTASGILHHQLLQYEMDKKEPASLKLRKAELSLVQEAINLITNNMRDPVNIDFLASSIGTNSAKLQHCFKTVYGTTVNGYIKKARIEKAAELLTYSDLTVTEIISEVGLINRGYFSKIFKAQYGLTPKLFRQRYRRV